MIDVTCFHCGNIVQISPDAERCAKCGANLRRLLGGRAGIRVLLSPRRRDGWEGNVIARSRKFSAAWPTSPVLSSTCLGAILCKRLGHLDEMRHYVAAIPETMPCGARPSGCCAPIRLASGPRSPDQAWEGAGRAACRHRRRRAPHAHGRNQPFRSSSSPAAAPPLGAPVLWLSVLTIVCVRRLVHLAESADDVVGRTAWRRRWGGR